MIPRFVNILVRFILTALVLVTPSIPSGLSQQLQETDNTPSGLPLISHYSFLRQDLNNLEYFGEAKSSFEGVFAKMEQLLFYGDGEIEVLHIGGSHVQAGTLSSRMRENMISMLGGCRGNPGFFFPYKLANTNGPSSVQVEYTGTWKGCRCAVNSNDCSWGMSGFNASTRDSSSTVKIWALRPDSSLYPFRKATVFHQGGDSVYCLDAFDRENLSAIIPNTASGYTVFTFEEPEDTLELSIYKTDTIEAEFSLQGILLEDQTGGLTYHTIGVNGASVASYLRCESFESHLQAIEPDLVIFGIGMNDAYAPNGDFDQAAYENGYRELMQKFKRRNPGVQFIFITNNDSYYKKKKVNRNAIRVCESMRKLAQEADAAVWDLFEIMGGLESIRAWEQAGLAKKDRVHLTQKGYVLQADLMSHALYRAFGDYLETKYSASNTENE